MKELLKITIPLLLLSLPVFLLIMGCSEDITAPSNNAPIIDSIVARPNFINPGSEFEIEAFASDPDNDSISFRWSTFYLAGFFSDTASKVCSVLVNKNLVGGMKLKIALDISDGILTVRDSIYVDLVPGERVIGHIYFKDTQIPAPGIIVRINKLIDTTTFRGEYILNDAPPGPAKIIIENNLCQADTVDIIIADSLVQNFYVQCPEANKTLAGQLKSNGGEPLSNVEIRVLNKDRTATFLADTTDFSGAFAIENVPVGERLISIREIDNQDFDILNDTLLIALADSSDVSLSGFIKERLFVFNGADQLPLWDLINDGEFAEWSYDSANDCLHYDYCEAAGMGLMQMAEAVPIPADARRVGFSIDATLNNAICFMVYKIDGADADGYSFDASTGDFVIEELVKTGQQSPIGRNFAMDFFASRLNGGGCGTVCVRNFEIFYFR